MHVGHLRTTVVGDALARTLERLGHHVIRQNHIGDWGTPFGMLIEHLLDVGEDSPEAALLETDPNAFYQAARADFDRDPAFAARARARVVALQAGDPDTMRLWGEVVELSKHYLNRVYDVMGVALTDADLYGESRYNAELAAICDELEAKGIARVSEGALCVFLDGYTGREGKPVPLIIRKSDGGYGYGVTDLATIRYRANQLHGSRILYVVGVTQALHFQMVWETARLAGWLPDGARPIHVQIGNVLGKDRKLLRTRSGETPRLSGLIDEAVTAARQRPRRGPPRPARGGPRGDRPADRHRRGQVRRPLRRPRQRVRLRPRPDGLADRQHRALPAVRGGAGPLDLPERRPRPDAPRAPVGSAAGWSSGTPASATWRWPWWSTGPWSPRSVTRSSRTGSPHTSSTWRRRSRPSTSTTRCSRPRTPSCASRGWPSAR